MKVSFVLPSSPKTPTGGTKVIYEYANFLASHKYEIHLYFYAGSFLQKVKIPNKLRHYIAKYEYLIRRPSWFKLDYRIKKHIFFDYYADWLQDGDIVVATGIDTARPVYEANEQKGKKMYLIQDFENWSRPTEMVYASYKYNMTNIVVSNWLKEIVEKTSKKEAVLLSNSINQKIFYFSTPLKNRKKHSIVFQYRSQPYKGGQYALKAIKILKQKYTDLEVNIISIEKKNKMIPNWCNYIYNAKPEAVAKVNNNSTVFISTSVDDGFGLPGLEAMACGCAFASFKYKGVNEYAVDGVNALLSPVKDVDKLVENVELLFENDKIRSKIVANGISTAKRRNIENNGQLFMEIINRLTD